MRIDIISAQPDLLKGPFDHSIIKRAQEKELASIHIHDLREYGLGKHRQIDDKAFGGGAGMVLMIEPIANLLDKLLSERKYDEVIYLTPDGTTLSQSLSNNFSLGDNYVFLCGHYKGIDERIREKYITKEISIGDYVLTGGELAAAVLTDSIIRLLPGVLNDETSALTDSFQDNLLAPPVYTRPSNFQNMDIPEVLLSGNQKLIDEWRMEQAIEKTKLRRPDIYKAFSED